jgi:hypothetical protein
VSTRIGRTRIKAKTIRVSPIRVYKISQAFHF